MEAFEQFVTQRSKDLKRIAAATRGEHHYNDVRQEAWMLAQHLSSRLKIAIEFADPMFQQLLLSHLYQHLVRYTELNVRRAVRLDHNNDANADEGSPHPLLNRLASDDEGPLAHWLAIERAGQQADQRPQLQSLAGAYAALLQRLDNRMTAVASYLLISSSYAYRCCARARGLAIHQNAMNLQVEAEHFRLEPWRRFRFVRIPCQLELDFRERGFL